MPAQRSRWTPTLMFSRTCRMRLSQEQRRCSSASECDEYLKKKCSALDRKTCVGCRDLPRMTAHTSSLLYGNANFRFAENPGLARQRSQPRLSEPIRRQVSGLSSGHKHVARRWRHLRPRSCVSSQNLNDRECDRDGNGEHRKQVARHSHGFVFMPRSLVVSHLSFTPHLPSACRTRHSRWG
jgi:hypothetical protein